MFHKGLKALPRICWLFYGRWSSGFFADLPKREDELSEVWGNLSRCFAVQRFVSDTWAKLPHVGGALYKGSGPKNAPQHSGWRNYNSICLDGTLPRNWYWKKNPKYGDHLVIKNKKGIMRNLKTTVGNWYWKFDFDEVLGFHFSMNISASNCGVL